MANRVIITRFVFSGGAYDPKLKLHQIIVFKVSFSLNVVFIPKEYYNSIVQNVLEYGELRIERKICYDDNCYLMNFNHFPFGTTISYITLVWVVFGRLLTNCNFSMD